MERIAPKKSLGQNFLVDKNISKKIVESLNAGENSLVIEIGPGTGALTEHLVQKQYQVISIEIDSRAAELIQKKFPCSSFPGFQLIESDFLRINLDDFKKFNKDIYVIGNIPYYISSEIFFKLFESSDYIKQSIMMIQKEVAKRLTAKPRTKDYGILTIAMELTGKAKILFDVPPSCFYPQPKVTPSIIEFVFNNNFDWKAYKEIMIYVRAAFNQRRKVLRNALKSIIEQKSKIGIDLFIKNAPANIAVYFEKRAEELIADDFKMITAYVKQLNETVG